MKKIREAHDNKDRIVVETTHNKHRMYYQPVGSSDRDRLWLFDTNYSMSIDGFFKNHGRNLGGRSYSITLNELYKHRINRYNCKIEKLLDRIPSLVDYVICDQREQEEYVQTSNISTQKYHHDYNEYDRVA